MLSGARGAFRILLVDGDLGRAEEHAAALRGDPRVSAVEVATTLAQTREMVTRIHPDVLLLEHRLGDGAGADLVATLGHPPSRPDVLMYSSAATPPAVVRAFQAGAQGWVTKGVPVTEVLTAVTELAVGHFYLSPPLVKPVVRLLLSEARGEESVPAVRLLEGLSPREVEVLRCLVSGMTGAEIAEHLQISVNTVRTHVQTLLRHAGVHSSLALVALARDAGVRGVERAR